MKSSKELYAEKAKLEVGKAEFDANVTAFLSQCDNLLSLAKSIGNSLSDSNDTFLSEYLSNISKQQLLTNITKYRESVSKEAGAADTRIQAKIDELAKEAAIRAAAELKAKKTLASIQNIQTSDSIINTNKM